MAVKVTRERVCDICEGSPTRPYRVGLPAPSRLMSLDLCEKDAAPLEAFRGLRKPRAGRLAEPRKVTTVANVSKQRRGAKKKPAKKAG